jgi:hypothetical protein
MKRTLVMAVLVIAASSLALGQTSGKKAGQSGDTEQSIRQGRWQLVAGQATSIAQQ